MVLTTEGEFFVKGGKEGDLQVDSVVVKCIQFVIGDGITHLHARGVCNG